ncbi:hypothetical protein BV22DRAFT_640017 [Leucogyrophana mollusca]|uniref:Uncharacterized protein n=1 Tax=Leucogyrophana mollusca TaxID=85980 RepID=A0ACB8BAE5_9AGAM|nr:hypothetical protein BV22DRAFT_640017 [Leucogyrophana mollusca]
MVFQNEVSGEGFVVTIGGWKDSLCVHVAKFHGVEGMDNASSSLSSVDAGYARPQHTLADGSRGCESIPDWAGLPLLSGERVTVTSRSDGTATWSTRVVITVVVDRPQCARVVCPPPKAPVIPGSAGCLEVELPVCASFLPSIPNAQYSGWIHRRG